MVGGAQAGGRGCRSAAGLTGAPWSATGPRGTGATAHNQRCRHPAPQTLRQTPADKLSRTGGEPVDLSTGCQTTCLGEVRACVLHGQGKVKRRVTVQFVLG